MKLLWTWSFVIFILFSCSQKEMDYEKIASFQDNSVDELNIKADSNSKVLLIFPHADDEITSAGLIQHLREKGATIHLLTLTHHPDTENNEQRLSELSCSAEKLGIEKVEVAGLINNTWENVMRDSIIFWYDQQDSIRLIIENKIIDYKPQIIITYDTELGGYGHPEHRISAQVTEDIFLSHANDSLFHPHTLLQTTLPDKLEEFLLEGNPAYDYSKKLTGNSGLPDPDFSLDIENYWPGKNEAAQCHTSQLKTLNKFYLNYAEENKAEHIKAFQREYYTVMRRE